MNSVTTSCSFVEVFFLGRITTICQMIAGLQKPVSVYSVIKNGLHMDEEPDRFREKRKLLKDKPIIHPHTPLNLKANKTKKENKLLTSEGKPAEGPGERESIQLWGSAKLGLASCPGGRF